MRTFLPFGTAGLLATVPMTLFMRLAQRHLPRKAAQPLPPEQITAKASRAAGLEAEPERPGWEWKTYLGHFSYGASAGAIYPRLFSRPARSCGAAIGRGCAFGLGVWALSYLGWLPAARILPPATRQHRSRNLLMILAHLIWGSCLALLHERTRVSRGR